MATPAPIAPGSPTRPVALDTETAYQATITGAEIDISRAGNTMAVIDYRLDASTESVRGWYVLSVARAARDLIAVAALVVGQHTATTTPIDDLLGLLIGGRCTVRLRQFVNQRGGTSFGVDRVSA